VAQYRRRTRDRRSCPGDHGRYGNGNGNGYGNGNGNGNGNGTRRRVTRAA
jgi:hypothetical protein